MKKKSLWVLVISLLLVFCARDLARGIWHEPIQSAPPAEKPVEQVFKNIQTLKGMPASQLYPTMNFMKASLGVDCQFCHVRSAQGDWDFAADTKPAKNAARKMITMVLDVNKASFGGQTEVNCYTCHHGQQRPDRIPVVLQSKSETESKSGPIGERASLPEVDQILNKYVEALGGKAAIEKTRTRILKGTIEAHLLPNSPIEIVQQAPDKIQFVITTPKGVITEGYNGAEGWVSDPRGVRPLDDTALAALKQEADIYRGLHLAERYTRMRVRGREKVRDRDAYVVFATTPDRQTDRLYFDVETGLLLRSVTYIQTVIGAIPETTDYDDYRAVDGVKIPFKVHREQLQGFEASTRALTEIKSNVEIDQSKFQKPPAKQ
jgi:photosynthetic reaction center cytochrome c subunit